MTRRIQIICTKCGSTDVGRDAWAQWDFRMQSWLLRNVFDQGYCFVCDVEVRLTERSLSEPANSTS